MVGCLLCVLRALALASAICCRNVEDDDAVEVADGAGLLLLLGPGSCSRSVVGGTVDADFCCTGLCGVGLVGNVPILDPGLGVLVFAGIADEMRRFLVGLGTLADVVVPDGFAMLVLRLRLGAGPGVNVLGGLFFEGDVGLAKPFSLFAVP